MTSLFMSLILTWPLITMAFSMVFGAGSLIWFLVCDLIIEPGITFVVSQINGTKNSFYLFRYFDK